MFYLVDIADTNELDITKLKAAYLHFLPVSFSSLLSEVPQTVADKHLMQAITELITGLVDDVVNEN